jgi:hypothetical protein
MVFPMSLLRVAENRGVAGTALLYEHTIDTALRGLFRPYRVLRDSDLRIEPAEIVTMKTECRSMKTNPCCLLVGSSVSMTNPRESIRKSRVLKPFLRCAVD